MGIVQLPIPIPGTVGIIPNEKYMVTTDNLTTITTAGYLNQVNLESNPLSNTDILQVLYSYNLQTTAGTYGVFTVSISGTGVITLTQAAFTGDVTLPTIANHLIVSTNTTGALANLTGTAINNGSLQAGLSGTAGTLISYPATGSKGSLIVAAVANTGNTNTTISNAAMGQASVISIPDPANAVGRFMIGATATPFVSGNIPKASGAAGLMVDSGIAATDIATTSTAVLLTPSGDQTITTNNLTVAQGNLVAGSSGHAGTVSSFPATAARGSLVLAAVNNTGDTLTTISNAAMGQASVISIPDPGAATAKFILDSGSQTMAVASNLALDKGTGTEVANAVTIDAQAGVITSAALTTAQYATETITLTNNKILTSSVVIASVMGGTNTTPGVTVSATAGSGTSTIVITNLNSSALNGTVIIGFAVF